MFQLSLIVLAVAAIIAFFKVKIPDIVLVVGFIAMIILFGKWLWDFEPMRIITIIAMMVLGSGLGDYLKTGEREGFWTALVLVVIVLFVNRGFVTRVYDPAHRLSFAEQYNVNQILRYDGKIEDGRLPIYIITQNSDGDKKREDRIKEKIKRKNDDYFMVFLNYDSFGNYTGTGYSYSLPAWREMGDIEEVQARISERMRKGGLTGNVEYIIECVDAEVHYYENPFEDY